MERSVIRGARRGLFTGPEYFPRIALRFIQATVCGLRLLIGEAASVIFAGGALVLLIKNQTGSLAG